MVSMSDFDSFSKAIQKKFFRTKEKVLETFGKADKTKDGDFDSLAATFHEQHATASKLLKSFRNYSAQVKAMSLASKNMHQAVSEAYEPSWDGSENFAVQTEQLSKIWDDYFVKVSETIQFHIVSYVAKFPELKNKIAKRGRKLLDYDRARHKLDTLEKAKKRDEYKITTATRELNAAQTIYESINSELFEELPVLYNSRIPVLSNYFSLFLRTEAAFEEDLTKIKRQMAELTTGLLKEQNLIASKSAIGTLRAKTLPRRDTPKMATSVDKRGKYSPQLGPKGIHSRNLDKGATLPPKPPSPKIPPFAYQPPPPQEPAPPPPTTAPQSPVYSVIGQPKSKSSGSPPAKPPQPQFGFYPPQATVQNSAHSNSRSSSSSPPPPLPPPPSSCNFSASSSSGQHQMILNTQSIISYVPQLSPLIGHSRTEEPSNPFESDLKSGDKKNQSEVGEQTLSVISEEATEAANKVGSSLAGEGRNPASAAAGVAEDASEVVNHTVEGVVKAGERLAQNVANNVEQQLDKHISTTGDHSEKVNEKTSKLSKKINDEVDRTKEGVSELGRTITENVNIVAGKMVNLENAVVDGASLSIGGTQTDGSSEAKEGKSAEITLPSNRYLYKVQATHNYSAADSDELSLDAGDALYVLPITNREYEDEGWALGLKQKDGTRGMFPVNFTKKIE